MVQEYLHLTAPETPDNGHLLQTVVNTHAELVISLEEIRKALREYKEDIEAQRQEMLTNKMQLRSIREKVERLGQHRAHFAPINDEPQFLIVIEKSFMQTKQQDNACSNEK